MEKHKDLKELLSFGLSLIQAGESALADGKFDLSDVIKFWEPLQKFNDALDGAANIPKSLSSLSTAEAKSIYGWASKEFDLKNDNIENIVEKGLNIALLIISGIAELKKK